MTAASTFDTALLQWALDHRTAWLDSIMRSVSASGDLLQLAIFTAAVAITLAVAGSREAAARVVVAVLVAWGLAVSLKALFGRQRPDSFEPLIDITTRSFPSGHALIASTAYVTAAVLLSRVLVAGASRRTVLIGAAITWSFLVGVSRVYLGVHYPTDVLGGWLIASALTAAASR